MIYPYQELVLQKDVEIKLLKEEMTKMVARNLVAWDTSKDKREGLLPEVYLTNKNLYKKLTGEDYRFHSAINKFNIE